MKVIVKNKETGKQKCIDIPKERENDSDIKALKVGMTVGYRENYYDTPELVEVVKIVDDRPKVNLDYIMHYMNMRNAALVYPKRAGKTVIIKKCSEDIAELKREHKELEEYQERPYFLVRLDPIKGRPDGKENLEKIKFPCWVVYRHGESGKKYIGQLITGFPDDEIEYQLVDMMEQVPVGECSTISRGTDLKGLMDKFYIEVIKGQTQLWKIGGFSV